MQSHTPLYLIKALSLLVFHGDRFRLSFLLLLPTLFIANSSD